MANCSILLDGIHNKNIEFSKQTDDFNEEFTETEKLLKQRGEK
jgi:hypothetical protein